MSKKVKLALIGAGGIFVAAAVVGPLVLARHPEVVPDATSHEEDPSADQHLR